MDKQLYKKHVYYIPEKKQSMPNDLYLVSVESCEI